MLQNPFPTIGKCPTCIEGLDEILHGGLPAGRTTVIVGGPGAGKSLLGLEFLYRGALAGEPGLFVSFEESAESLRIYAATLGWDLAPHEQENRLFLLGAHIDPKAIVIGDVSIQPFLAILDGQIKAMHARYIVIDALDVLMRLIGDERRAQDELMALHYWLESREVTALLLIKASSRLERGPHFDVLDYMADCVIHLDNRTIGQLSTRRLRVIKYRGSAFGSNEYPFVIEPPGIMLLPISSVGLSHRPLGARFTSGLAALDELTGGGFRHNSSILVTGSTGSGKTTLCSHFTSAACARGERVLLISFEESEAAMVSAMISVGIDLAPHIATGRLHLISTMPEAMGAEHHLVRAFAAIRQMQPNYVVVESASACKRMGTDQAAFEYLMRLINAGKEMGITIVVTNQTAGFHSFDEISGIGISSLIDTVIQLRLVEDQGALRRNLLVMKSRGSKHSQHYRDFVITDSGIEIQQEGA